MFMFSIMISTNSRHARLRTSAGSTGASSYRKEIVLMFNYIIIILILIFFYSGSIYILFNYSVNTTTTTNTITTITAITAITTNVQLLNVQLLQTADVDACI